MNSSPNRPNSIDGDEAVRLALVDLTTLYHRHDPAGVSGAEMARAIGVSPQQMQRILEGTRRLHPGQIVRLPRQAFRAVMAALETTRGEATPSTPEREGGALISTMGDALSDLGKALSDGVISPAERPQVRIGVVTVRKHCDAIIRSLDAVDAKERLVAS